MSKSEIAKSQSTSAPHTVDVFDSMRTEMNRLLDTFDRSWPRLPGLFSRARDHEMVGLDIDVRDDGGSIVIEAELPGVDEKNISVKVANGFLTISGEKKLQREERSGQYYISERSFGSFQRAVRLPDIVDETKIDAKFDKGVLRVTAAKKPEAVKAERMIEVKKG